MTISQPSVKFTVCSEIIKPKSGKVLLSNFYGEEGDVEYYYSYFFDKFKPDPACYVTCSLGDLCGQTTIQ